MIRIVLILSFLIPSLAFSQSYVKTNVKALRLRNNGAIIQNNQVTGYYLFYKIEKANDSNNNYAFIIIDENLREVSNITISQPKTFNVIEVSFNGTAFALLGYEKKYHAIHLYTYDTSLKEIGKLVRLIKNRNLNQAYGSYVTGNEPEQSFLVPVENRGFLLYHMAQENELHYRIDMVSNTLESIWVDQAPPTAEVEVAMSSLQNSRYIGSLIEMRSRRGATNVSYDLLVNRTSTGERLFRTPVKSNRFDMAVADVKYDSVKNEFVAFGEYYSQNQNEARDRSLGFMSMVFDTTGTVVDTKTTSWQDLAGVTPVNARGKIEGENYNVLFHNTVRTSDGQLFVIGEQYKRVPNPGGVALNILALATGSGSQVTAGVKLEVGGMVIFQFNPDYTINKVHFFDKTRSRFSLPSGSLYYSPKVIGQYGKAWGYFDYRFTQNLTDMSGFIVNYVDYSREPNDKGLVVGSIVYSPEKMFVLDKFKLERHSNQYWVGRAKEGYILISEYYGMQKRLESRLEKINY